MSALKKRSTHGSVAHSRGQGCRLYLGITHLAVVFKTVIGEWNYLGKDFKVKKKNLGTYFPLQKRYWQNPPSGMSPPLLQSLSLSAPLRSHPQTG